MATGTIHIFSIKVTICRNWYGVIPNLVLRKVKMIAFQKPHSYHHLLYSDMEQFLFYFILIFSQLSLNNSPEIQENTP